MYRWKEPTQPPPFPNQVLKSKPNSSGKAKVKQDKFWLVFKDRDLEKEYEVAHDRRMSRGFLSTTLLRICSLFVVGLNYLLAYDADLGVNSQTSVAVSFSALGVDLLLLAYFFLHHSKKTGIKTSGMQVLSTISCASEGSFIAVAASSVKYDSSVYGANNIHTQIAAQFLIMGCFTVALKFSFGNPRISLLRFPYLVLVMFIIFMTEVCCAFLIFDEIPLGGSVIARNLYLISSSMCVGFALVNSHNADMSDRKMYLLLKKEEQHIKAMSDQIEHTNMMARTVLAMSDAGSSGDGYESSGEGNAGNSETEADNNNMVEEVRVKRGTLIDAGAKTFELLLLLIIVIIFFYCVHAILHFLLTHRTLCYFFSLTFSAV